MSQSRSIPGMGPEDRIRRLKDWLDLAPIGDTDELLAQLEETQRLFLEETAFRLEGPFNRRLDVFRKCDAKMKQTVVLQVNGDLAKLGLGILHEETGRVGVLGSASKLAKQGSFQLRVTDKDGMVTAVWTSTVLPWLSLAPRPPRRRYEPIANRVVREAISRTRP